MCIDNVLGPKAVSLGNTESGWIRPGQEDLGGDEKALGINLGGGQKALVGVQKALEGGGCQEVRCVCAV